LHLVQSLNNSSQFIFLNFTEGCQDDQSGKHVATLTTVTVGATATHSDALDLAIVWDSNKAFPGCHGCKGGLSFVVDNVRELGVVRQRDSTEIARLVLSNVLAVRMQEEPSHHD
jgi:hypothetical protein